MMTNKLKQAANLIFLPATLLSVLLAGSSTLFHLARNALMGTHLDALQVMALKTPMILPQIILVLTLLIVSKHKPFEKVFRGTLVALTGIVSLLAGLMFFQDHLQLQGMTETLGRFLPEHMVHIYEPHISNWPTSLFYIVSSLLSFNLFSVLIWGFINRLTNSSEGTKYYLPLAFVLGLAGTLATNLGLLLIGAASWPVMALAIPAIALMVCALMTFNWAWKRIPNDVIHPTEAAMNSQTRFPFLSGAYLLAGCVMVKNLLTIIFKSQLKTQLPSPAAYSEFMGHYSIAVGSSTIAISALWVVLGTWLLLRKGWRTTAICGSISILTGGLIFLGSSTASESVSWLSQGIYTGALVGTTSALFFPLVQMLYLYMPYQTRFRAKVATEMVALPLMKAVPSLITQGLVVVFMSISAITIYLKILVPILMVLLVLAIKRISSKFSDRFPVATS